MEQIFIGIDGGGTKTHVIAENSKGEKFEAIYGGSNYHVIGVETFSKMYEEILSQVSAHYGVKKDQLSVVFGGAGVDTEQDKNTLLGVSRALGVQTHFVNDSVIALVANVGSLDGGVLISGTGSIALACVNENFTRVGGWGPRIGDEGSGYALGRDLLTLCAHMIDGRAERTEVLESVFKHIGTDENNLSDYVNVEHVTKDQIAALVPIVFQYQNDTEVQKIIQRATLDLYRHVKVLDSIMPDAFPIILIGGVLTNTPIGQGLIDFAKEKAITRPIVIGTVPPSCGALWLAKRGGIK